MIGIILSSRHLDAPGQRAGLASKFVDGVHLVPAGLAGIEVELDSGPLPKSHDRAASLREQGVVAAHAEDGRAQQGEASMHDRKKMYFSIAFHRIQPCHWISLFPGTFNVALSTDATSMGSIGRDVSCFRSFLY